MACCFLFRLYSLQDILVTVYTTKLLTIEKIHFCDSLQVPASSYKSLQVHYNILVSTLM
jgi:hypothetical protein